MKREYIPENWSHTPSEVTPSPEMLNMMQSLLNSSGIIINNESQNSSSLLQSSLTSTPLLQPSSSLLSSSASISGVDSVDSDSSTKKRKFVRNACSNCRKAHAKCDENLPCGRCVRMRLTETCLPAPSQKRGRKKAKGVAQETEPTQNLSFKDLLSEIITGTTENAAIMEEKVNRQSLEETVNRMLYANIQQMSSVTPISSTTITLSPLATQNISPDQEISEATFWYKPDQIMTFNQPTTFDSSQLLLTEYPQGNQNSQLHKLNEAVTHLQRENQLLREQLQKRSLNNTILDNLTGENNANVGLMVTVRPGKIVSCNSYLLSKLGYDSSFFEQQRYWHEVVHPLYWDIIVRKIQDVFQHKLDSFSVDNIMVKKNEKDQFLLAKKVVMSFFYDQSVKLPLFGVCRIYF
jgi:hypothetical protein